MCKRVDVAPSVTAADPSKRNASASNTASASTHRSIDRCRSFFGAEIIVSANTQEPGAKPIEIPHGCSH